TPDGSRLFVGLGPASQIAELDTNPADGALYNTVISTRPVVFSATDVAIVSQGAFGTRLYATSLGTVPLNDPSTAGNTVATFSIAAAGGGAMVGTVTDQASGDPISGAVVQVCGTGDQSADCVNTVSSPTGTYEADDLSPGAKVVTVSPADATHAL